MIVEARVRSEIYAALAAAFGSPRAELLSGWLGEVLVKGHRELEIALPGEELAELAEAVARLDEPGLARLRWEHTRLFEGPGQPAVYPYESLYRDGDLAWGEVAAQVRHRYAAAGLGLAPGFRDLPDHVVAELEFMGYLWARQAQAHEGLRWEEAVDFLAQSRSFLREHLDMWFPVFCQGILAATREPFYLALASLARRFVFDEARQAESSKPAPAGGWALRIRGDGCLLCEACVQGCAPGALRLAREEGIVGLVFGAAFCNGCRRCLEVCPVGVLSLIPAPEGIHEEGERWLARSALAWCSRCGEAMGAEVTWDWVRQRLAGGFGAEMVSWCFRCRYQALVQSSPSLGGKEKAHGP